MVKQPEREHFDYCWPADARIVALDASEGHLSITFDRFTVSLDDPHNRSGLDLVIGLNLCRFISPRKTELRLWPDDKSFRLDVELSKLVGCTLEDSGDTPSVEGPYFEMMGFCDSEWFELRVFADKYELEISDKDHQRLNPIN
jgi:hypothetical protein